MRRMNKSKFRDNQVQKQRIVNINYWTQETTSQQTARSAGGQNSTG